MLPGSVLRKKPSKLRNEGKLFESKEQHMAEFVLRSCMKEMALKVRIPGDS